MSNKKKINNYFIKEGYEVRSITKNFIDKQQGITYQPDVYSLAYQLAEKFGSEYIIDIGCRNGDKLTDFYKKFNVLKVGQAVNLKRCQERYSQGRWLKCDLNSPQKLSIPKKCLKNSVIICTKIIECLKNPEYLLENLKHLMNKAAVCLISTPERILARGKEDFGPPPNSLHVREWNLQEFNDLLNYFDFNIEFIGLTVNNDQKLEKKSILAVIGNNNISLKSQDDFKVAAIMTVYNEEDIIYYSINKLLKRDIQIYVIDNWSSDDSFQIIKRFKRDKNFLGSERFPPSGPTSTFNLTNLLNRIEEVTKIIEADWFIYQDVDEVRISPWEMSLKDAIFYVDCLGYNAIDHTVINFCPTDNGYTNQDPEEYFNYFEFGKLQSNFMQVKAWKNTEQNINLAQTAGHMVEFEGRKICPYKFITKHYPIRSQVHGEKKIFKDRKPRWNPKERKKGWHTQYDYIQPGHSFIRDAAILNEYIDDQYFRTKYLVEMISGIGIGR